MDAPYPCRLKVDPQILAGAIVVSLSYRVGNDSFHFQSLSVGRLRAVDLASSHRRLPFPPSQPSFGTSNHAKESLPESQ